MQKMLQQVMTAPGHIEFREAPVPAPNAGEVLVKIMKIGVCGSDIHVYHGEHPFTKYPVTQGHEVSGKIAALGEGVTGFAIGQKVTIEPQVYCGRCHPCTHGKYNLCEELRVMGFQTTGTASEYFAVDAGKVTPLPETMTYSEGAMIEPLAVTVHVPFPVSWTVKMKKKQKETQDILSYHTQAAGCSDKARAKASGGRQPIEECGRTGL